MRWLDHTIAFLSIFLMAGIAQAAPDQNSSNAFPAAAEPAPTAQSGQKIDLPVPVGEPVKGIKIPQYDESGKMTMCLSADTAQKINEHQVDLGKLKVQFDEKENKEIIVEIPHSILDLETKILTADTQTVIHREDFEIIGENAVFDTMTRQGSFKGHVHASFLNASPVETPINSISKP